MLTKEQVEVTVKELPEQFDIDVLIERLIVLDKIQKGIDDSNAGNVFSEEEVESRLENWLK